MDEESERSQPWWFLVVSGAALVAAGCWFAWDGTRVLEEAGPLLRYAVGGGIAFGGFTVIRDGLRRRSRDPARSEALDTGTTSAADIKQLAKTMLEAGEAVLDDGAFIPLGATLGRDGEVRIVAPLPAESLSGMRDFLVRSLSASARSGGIKAAGIITSNVLPELGKFLAVSVQHEDGTSVAFVERFTIGEDGKPVFDPDLLMQRGAYEFFPAQEGRGSADGTEG